LCCILLPAASTSDMARAVLNSSFISTLGRALSPSTCNRPLAPDGFAVPEAKVANEVEQVAEHVKFGNTAEVEIELLT
jgi:hypothetical protein